MPQDPFIYRQYAYLSITGSGKSAVITDVLEIEPDEEWSEGDAWRPEPMSSKRFSMRWKLNSGGLETDDLNHHIALILNQLKRKREVLLSLLGKYDVTIVCVSYNLQGFCFELDFNLQRTLTDFGIRLWFDAYNLTDPHAEINDLKDQLKALEFKKMN